MGEKETAAVRRRDPQAAKAFSVLGLGMFTVLAVTTALQLLLLPLTERDPSDWKFWLAAFAPMYLVGIPLGCLIMRFVPKSSVVPGRKFTFGEMGTLFLIAFFLMYAGNLLGTFVSSSIADSFGVQPANPIDELTVGSSLLPRILVMAILGPVMEELLCRRMLIDRMRGYGEKLAVITSAAVFALFHGNLSQMFYAFTVGLLLGYVYLRTGKLRYSAILHILLNTVSGVAASLILERVDLDALASLDLGTLTEAEPEQLLAMLSGQLPQLLLLEGYALAVLGMGIAGLVLLCCNAKKVVFAPAEKELPQKARFATVWGNLGMLLFFAACMALVVLSFLS